MYFSTTLPSFPLRTLPVRYAVRTPYLRSGFARTATPAVSGRWADDAYELTADLAGIAEDSVAVSLAGRTLTIDVTTDELTWNERIRLPQTLDPEQVAACYVNGRLTVTIGKTAEPAPRAIAIDTTPVLAELVSADTDADVPSEDGQVPSAQAEATEASVTE